MTASFLLSLASLASCQAQQPPRREIEPLFEGLTSTPGNQFTFQPQPAVPGLELTSPSPLPSFQAVPIGNYHRLLMTNQVKNFFSCSPHHPSPGGASLTEEQPSTNTYSCHSSTSSPSNSSSHSNNSTTYREPVSVWSESPRSVSQATSHLPESS